MCKTLGKRIKTAREIKNLSQQDLAELIGRHKNTISRYENDKRIPDADDTQKLCTALQLSPKWLLYGDNDEVERLPTQEISIQPVSLGTYSCDISKDGSEMIAVPLIKARLSAGGGSFEVQNDVEDYCAFSSSFLHRKGDVRSMVVMRVQGDSMQPEIMDGDIVLLDQSKKEMNLGRLYAVGFEDAIYLKRIDKEPGKIILKSVNPEYNPIVIETSEQILDQFRVIGQVLWVGREYRN